MRDHDDVVDGRNLDGREIKGMFRQAHDHVGKRGQAPASRAEEVRRFELKPPTPFRCGEVWWPKEQRDPCTQQRVEGKKVRALMDRMLAARAFNRAVRDEREGMER